MPANIVLCGKGGSNLELYRTRLGEEGHEVAALPGLEEPNSIAEEKPDLLVVDLSGVGPAEIELLAELARVVPGERIVILPAAPSPEALQALKGAGAFEVLSRPFSVARLVVTVTNALRKLELTRGGPPLASPTAQTAPPRPEPAAGAGAGGASERVAELEADLEKARERNKRGELDRARIEGYEQKIEALKSLARRKDQDLARIREELQAAERSADTQRAQAQARETSLLKDLDGLRATYTAQVESHRKAREAAEAEARTLMGDLQGRIEKHQAQLELLTRDEGTLKSTYEQRMRALGDELEATSKRAEQLHREKEELLAANAEDRGAFKALRKHIEDAQREADELRKSRDELQKRLDGEIRKRFNEVRVLVKERKKLLEERATATEQLAADLEAERAKVKQLVLEVEGLKSDLPTERQKVLALVEYQRSLLSNVLAGVLTIDTVGQITLGNEQAALMVGIKLSELLGTHLDAHPRLAVLRPLFAKALAGEKAGPVELELDPNRKLRTVANKVPFGPRELVLFSFATGATPVPAMVPAPAAVDDPLARLGAAVAGNIADVQDYAVEIRGYLERVYGKTETGSPAREETNHAMRKVGEMIDFLRDIIEQAESYLS